ncbi:unnamed protein product, partial [Polarella glacialis]
VSSPPDKGEVLCTVEVERAWLVSSLKAAIEEAIGIPRAQQSLHVGERALRDQDVLGSALEAQSSTELQ